MYTKKDSLIYLIYGNKVFIFGTYLPLYHICLVFSATLPSSQQLHLELTQVG